MQESDPRIRILARRAAIKIKALRSANEKEIEEIYREFQTQAKAIKASADELDTRSADPSQTTEEQSIGVFTS